MTKLKLELAQAAGEILTREEQKRILGGAMGSGEKDPCEGKTSYHKCSVSTGTSPDDADKPQKEWTGTGCPKLEKKPCPEEQAYTCSC